MTGECLHRCICGSPVLGGRSAAGCGATCRAKELLTVSSTAEFVVRYIADFEGAAADDRDAALGSQSS